MKYFGTDGIRQKADEFTSDFLGFVAKGLVDYAGEDAKILLAGDTRESSERIIRDLEIALESLGVEYASADVLPTPAINFCFYQMGFDFAIDVTASHNPFTDNGLKFFERGNQTGVKLSEEGCKIIEKAIEEAEPLALISPSLRENLHEEAVSLYVEHLKNYVGELNLSNLNIGIDCANGATSVISSSVFDSFSAKTDLIHANPNYNTEINNACGSTHLESLTKLVLENHLDLGIAFDGDGDRCLLIDENGELVDGDEIIAIIANYLKLDSLAVTVMANQGILNWAENNNLKLEITAVGDSNVAATMREKNISIGGEQSGHIILPGETTGDGMLTALMIVKILSESGQSLSALKQIIQKYPQITLNMSATPEQKANLKTSETAKTTLLDFNKKLESVSGRLLVRPSGTENLIRITMWGNDENIIASLAEELKTKLGEIL